MNKMYKTQLKRNEIMEFHSISASQALAEKSSSSSGLSTIQAKQRLKENGKNELAAVKKKNLFQRFLMQLADFSIIILLAAAAISYMVSRMSGEADLTDTIVILAIVVLNAIIGVFEESKAQKALDALKVLSAPEAAVKRDGKIIKLPASEVVNGDILVLKAGDMVPADARLISSAELKTDESSLTGEALPIQKYADVCLPSETETADRKNMVFSSTLITYGRGEAVVVSTGMNTQIGKIAKMLSHQEEEDTPLQKRLEKLSKMLGTGALAICAVIFVLGLARRASAIDSFMTAISLAVAAIPEGLPAIVTIVLSMGVGKLSKKNAVVRRLPSIETLGSATVICSDKTGTLTQNKMTATKLYIPGKSETDAHSADGKELLMYGALCCDSVLEKRKGTLTAVGEPTENAILNAFYASKQSYSEMKKQYPRIAEKPFQSEQKL